MQPTEPTQLQVQPTEPSSAAGSKAEAPSTSTSPSASPSGYGAVDGDVTITDTPLAGLNKLTLEPAVAPAVAVVEG